MPLRCVGCWRAVPETYSFSISRTFASSFLSFIRFRYFLLYLNTLLFCLRNDTNSCFFHKSQAYRGTWRRRSCNSYFSLLKQSPFLPPETYARTFEHVQRVVSFRSPSLLNHEVAISLHLSISFPFRVYRRITRLALAILAAHLLFLPYADSSKSPGDISTQV